MVRTIKGQNDKRSEPKEIRTINGQNQKKVKTEKG